MTAEAPRRPAAFSVPQSETAEPADDGAKRRGAKPRKPRAVSAGAVVAVTPPQDDFFESVADDAVAPPAPMRRGFGFAKLFTVALGALVSIAFGLWIDGFVRAMFARGDWLGWTVLALAAAAAIGLAGVLAREALALRRLASVESLQRRATDALAHSSPRQARDLLDDLVRFLRARPETAQGRHNLAGLGDDIIDGPDLVRLAETELLTPLDAKARALVLAAAKRVSIVTAVSPRALVDIGYVLFEAARLMRAIAVVYGGRPGTLGFLRLARSVLSHLAVTGTMAIGDSLAGQLLGHGVAARLSARLGEGVVNGLMTVRIGIAAMDAARPMPFTALKKPGIADFAGALWRTEPQTGDGEPDAAGKTE